MANIRAYKLAEELGIDRAEIVEKAEAVGVELKTAMVALDPDQADDLRAKLGGTRLKNVSETRLVSGKGGSVIRRRKRAEPVPEPVPEPVSHDPSTPFRRIRRYAAIAMVIGGGLAIGTQLHGDFKLFQARTEASLLVEPLEQYRETHGRYPGDLEALAEARGIEDGSLRRIHYELHDGGDAFFMSCRMGVDLHQWDVFDSQMGRWETR